MRSRLIYTAIRKPMSRNLLILTLIVGAAVLVQGVAAAQPVPPALLVFAANPSARTVIILEPGFGLVMVFDAPIDFVALGDDQVVALSVKGEEGIIGMRPLGSGGRTNMHVQAGGVLMVFEIRVSRGPRTADVIRVVTQQVGGSASSLPQQPSAQPAERKEEERERREKKVDTGSPPRRVSVPVGWERLAGPVAFLTEENVARLVELSERGVRAAFQAYRTPVGIEVRYQITNASGVPWNVVPYRILVRADGRIVPVKVLRHPASADGKTLPHGGVETGIISVGEGARTLVLTFPLFQDAVHWALLPIVFTARFENVNALPEVGPR